jgi:hypothetical protein
MTNPEAPSAAPVAWCRSDEFAQFTQAREYLLAFREQYSDCDMPLYAHPQASAIAPDAGQAEGPSLADVDELCAEFGFLYRGTVLKDMRDMITAAITRWHAPAVEPVALPVGPATTAPQEPDVERIGCHDGPAAPPAPDHVNLIGFALGREPWATWLRQGGCLESAHCELSDLMLAVLAKWGRPTALPAPGEAEELVSNLNQFIDEYNKMKGLDPEFIYSIQVGVEGREACLRISSLARIAELLKGTTHA